MNSTEKGKKAEEKACEFLISLNFEIITTNFFCKGGEIDIIARKNGVIHFVEVKSGIGFEPVFNITPTKIKRIVKCAYIFLKKYGINSPFCVDAVIIKGDELSFLENITF